MTTPDTLDTKEIAALLRLSVGHVRNRLVHEPGFPRPVLAPGPKKRQWSREEVIAWATPQERRQAEGRA